MSSDPSKDIDELLHENQLKHLDIIEEQTEDVPMQVKSNDNRN
jgi:hypothetical protein